MSFTIIADKNIGTVQVKNCKRCEQKGQPFTHPLENFSVKKDGKPHSYCKACRAADTKEWTDSKKAERAQYQIDYRNKRRAKVYYGNIYKRRANKPVIPNVAGQSFADAVEVQVIDGELVPVTKFQKLLVAFNCKAVHISVREKQ